MASRQQHLVFEASIPEGDGLQPPVVLWDVTCGKRCNSEAYPDKLADPCGISDLEGDVQRYAGRPRGRVDRTAHRDGLWKGDEPFAHEIRQADAAPSSKVVFS